MNVVMLTGQPGSGKSTLAQQMKDAGLVDGVVALARAVNSPMGRHVTMWVLMLVAWTLWLVHGSGLALGAFIVCCFIDGLLD